MSRDPKTTCIVLHHTMAEWLQECIESIEHSTLKPGRVIIVDNDPDKVGKESDAAGVVAKANEQGEAVYELVAPPDNTGFGAGVNLAVNEAGGSCWNKLMLLNDDAVLEPSCIEVLGGVLDRPDVGVAGAVTRRYSKPWVVESSGMMVDPWTFRIKHDTTPPGFDTMDKDAVSGCAMMVQRELFEKFGGFHAGYFMYFEDVELCMRARESGWRVVVAGRAEVYHRGGRLTAPDRTYYSTRNQLILAARLAGHGFKRSVPFILLFNAMAALKRENRLKGLEAFFSGALHGLKGRTGARPE